MKEKQQQQRWTTTYPDRWLYALQTEEHIHVGDALFQLTIDGSQKVERLREVIIMDHPSVGRRYVPY